MFSIARLFRFAHRGKADRPGTATVEVVVTRDDIDRGLVGDGLYGPLNHAVARKVPGHEVEVSAGTMTVRLGDRPPTPLPEAAAEFLREFNRGGGNALRAKPFTFAIDVPADLLPWPG